MQWSDVSLEQYIEFSKIDKSLGSYHTNSEAISILLDIPIEEVEEMDVEDMYELIKVNKWANSEPSKRYKHSLLDMKFKPFSKLTLYEYIDLDYFFTQNYLQNLDKIVAIMYRKYKLNEWSDEVMEGYEYDCNLRAQLFHDLPITDVYGIIHEFIKYRDTFLKNYEHLFSGELDQDLTAEEKANMEADEIKEIEREQRKAKWSWEQTLYNLSNGDITKIPEIGKLPLIFVFNMLAMRKDLDV